MTTKHKLNGVEKSDFETFLETDTQLQEHYLKLLDACGSRWTNDEIARAAFHLVYDTDDHEAKVEHLVIAARCRRAIRNDDPYQIELANAAYMWQVGQGQK